MEGRKEKGWCGAPSWVWLAVDGPIWVYATGLTPDANIVDCIVEPVDPMNLEGPFRSGKLTIEAAFLLGFEFPARTAVAQLHDILKGSSACNDM